MRNRSPRGRLVVLGSTLLALLVAAPAGAAEDPAPWNRPGVNHCYDWAPIKGSPTLRDASFNSINQWISGNVPFQAHEAIKATTPWGSAATLYYARGSVTGQPNGHLWVADLYERPVAPSGCSTAGNGTTAPLISGKSYYLDPQPIPDQLRFSETDGEPNTYTEYGVRGDGHRKYVTWSWVTDGSRCDRYGAISGGGVTRALVSRGEVFYPANVRRITCSDYTGNVAGSGRAQDGVDNGWVQAMYGYFWTGQQRVWGWTVHSHSYNGVYTNHVNCRSGC